MIKYAVLGRSEPLIGVLTHPHLETVSEAENELQRVLRLAPEYTPYRIVTLQLEG